jgi:hypothetical protein
MSWRFSTSDPRRFAFLTTSFFGEAQRFSDTQDKQTSITMTMSSEEIQSKFFDYVDQRQALYIERLGEAVA